MNRKLFLLLVSGIVLNTACTPHKAFDEAGWKEKDDSGIYPNRNSMLKDLTTRHRLKGLSFKSLTKRLGKPEGFSETKTNTAYYNISKEFERGAEPVYIKNLLVMFDADSIISQYGIEEITHD